MKEIRITVRRQKTELRWLAWSFAAAFALNAVAILIYKTSWTELWSQILWVLAFTLFFYITSVVVRWIGKLVLKN